jgi:hypothetical protein
VQYNANSQPVDGMTDFIGDVFVGAFQCRVPDMGGPSVFTYAYLQRWNYWGYQLNCSLPTMTAQVCTPTACWMACCVTPPRRQAAGGAHPPHRMRGTSRRGRPACSGLDMQQHRQRATSPRDYFTLALRCAADVLSASRRVALGACAE